MKRLRIGLAAVVPAALLSFGAYALAVQEAPGRPLASSGHGSMGMGTGSMIGHGGFIHGRPITAMLQFKEKLGLTAEQVTRLDGLRSAYQQEAQKRVEILRAREAELHDLIAADQTDLGRIEAKFREVQQTAAEENLARIRTIVQAKETLTPAQREQFRALIEGSGMTMGEAQPGQEAPASRGCHDQPGATPIPGTRT